MGEFWVPKNNEQLAFHEKELKKVITRQTDIVNSTTMENIMRDYERLDNNNDDKFIL